MTLSSAGNTRGLIEASGTALALPPGSWSSAGNTRGLIEARGGWRDRDRTERWSSAGNTRGLIEACSGPPRPARASCLPRGIPAASLKHSQVCAFGSVALRLPRGIPAASLKLNEGLQRGLIRLASSAGNTRGLIEARQDGRVLARVACGSSAGNTRGLIEASLNSPSSPAFSSRSSAGNTRGLIEASSSVSAVSARSLRLPRGIPAASLKLHDYLFFPKCDGREVFRGEYPRPH